MISIKRVLIIGLFLFNPYLYSNTSFSSQSITYKTALLLITDVLNEAQKRNLTLAVSIADPAGHLVAFGRSDGTKPIVLTVAQGKAYTAAIARNKTGVIQEKALPEGPAYGGVTNIEKVMVIQGGVPIFHNGHCIGGIGVSGTSATEDEEIAELAISKLDLK